MANSDRDQAEPISHHCQNTRPSAAIAAGQRHAERPVAARAEEADLAGAVGDLGVRPVLRARVDAPGDEPEVAAAHRAQQARQDQRDDADPLDVPPVCAVASTSRRGSRRANRNAAMTSEDAVLGLHGSQLPVRRTVRLQALRGGVERLRGRRVRRPRRSRVSASGVRLAGLLRPPGTGRTCPARRPAARSSSSSGRCRTARRSGRRRRPRRSRVDLEHVAPRCREDVPLEQQLRHPERVDDVLGWSPRTGSARWSAAPAPGCSRSSPSVATGRAVRRRLPSR